MKRVTIRNPEEAKGIIRNEIQRTNETRFQHRLHCILLICDGKTCADVTALFGDSLRIVQYWVKRYNEAGVDGLRDPTRVGRNPRLLPGDKDVLAQDLRRSPREFGYTQKLWDGKLLSHHLKERFNVELKVRQCQYLFHQLGFRRRKPRPVIAKANRAAQEAYKKTGSPGR
ncbi:MAG: winged helix-turn-helix domain-containing protein [Dehalococcoidia bacterium]|nr:winged helix-turn-helix domain-containing protein [Dehalococcoidia bacterium]